MYVYMYREREREIHVYIYIYMHTYINMWMSFGDHSLTLGQCRED